MRVLSPDLVAIVATLVVLVSSVGASSPHVHASIARRHMHGHSLAKRGQLQKRTKCEFPKDAGLVPVAPKEKNAGWAMSPDQPCVPDSYCPYACPPGQLMAQWDPKATTYSYPASMNGGLYCNKNGEIEKPFPQKPYCVDGAGTVRCKNKAGKNVAICQTVLPGNEAMLIPTDVKSTAILSVPDRSYWASTSAHFYINPPGVSVEEGCIWGSKDNPVGNWAPYVAGANQMDNGDTFVTIGWNPIYLEDNVPFRNTIPNWGVKIECDGKCNGLPCYIDPKEHKVNEVSQMKGAGAGGANFCVVTASKGSTANIIVFNKDGGSSSDIDIKSPKDEKKAGNIGDLSVKTSPAKSQTTTSQPPPPTTSSTSTSSTSSTSSIFSSSTSSKSTSATPTTSPTTSASSYPSSSTLSPSGTSHFTYTSTLHLKWSTPTNAPTPSHHVPLGNGTVTYIPAPTGAIPTPSGNSTVLTSGLPVPQPASSGVPLALSGTSAFLVSSMAAMFVMAF